MSDSEDSTDYWFNTAALTEELPPIADELRPAKAKLRDQWAASKSLKDKVAAVRNADLKGLATDWAVHGSAPSAIQLFAESNGFNFERRRGIPVRDKLPGMIFRSGECINVVSFGDPQVVEIGNYSNLGGAMPQAFGYIAVRHDLDLPHLILDSRANDAEPPNGLSKVYARKDNYSSLNANYRGSDTGTPLTFAKSDARLRGGSIEALDLGEGIAEQFQIWCESGREADAREFLSGARMTALTDLGSAFDIEIRDSWIFLYGYAFEVSTIEPERWAWVFSVTSRVLDQVQAWGSPSLATGRPPFYTDRRVARPERLEKLPKPSPGWHATWDDGLWS